MKLRGGEVSRRRFLVTGAASVGGAACSSLPTFVQTKKRVLHVVGHSHIDAAWLWPWRDGSNLVLTTMHSALDRMRKDKSTALLSSTTRPTPTTAEGVILRVQERAGRPTELPIDSAPLNLKHRAQLKPWEMKTLLLGRARAREVSALEH